jgi:hypothetical protein
VDGARQGWTALNLLNSPAEPNGQSDPALRDSCYLLLQGYTSFDLSADDFCAILHAAWDLALVRRGKEKHNIIGIAFAVDVADA